MTVMGSPMAGVGIAAPDREDFDLEGLGYEGPTVAETGERLAMKSPEEYAQIVAAKGRAPAPVPKGTITPFPQQPPPQQFPPQQLPPQQPPPQVPDAAKTDYPPPTAPGISTGVKVLIGVGVAVAVLGLGFLVIWKLKKKRTVAGLDDFDLDADEDECPCAAE